MKVRVINKSKHELPQYATEFSAGMDLKANLEQNAVLRPFERVVIPTGIYMELPAGYEGQVRPRSGLAQKEGVTVLNAPGTIDADYRGEVKVLLVNKSHEVTEVEDGQRIAQLVVAKHEWVEWEATQELSNTERGHGGYGHTGN